jgi:F0F1-type ATP synthase beta subunit
MLEEPTREPLGLGHEVLHTGVETVDLLVPLARPASGLAGPASAASGTG